MPQIETPRRVREGFPGQRMIVLPRPMLHETLASQRLMTLLPSDVGYFPEASFHYVDRPEGCPQLILILCVQGEGWAQIKDQTYAIRPGHMVVIPPEQPHSYGAAAERPWSIHWCHVSGPAAADFAGVLLEGNGSPVLEIADYSRLVELFEEIADELSRGYAWNHLFPASAALVRLLGLTYSFRKSFPDASPDATDRIRQAIFFLDHHLDRQVSVPELARIANLSVSHFCALFKRAAGFPPLEYFLHRKIQHACELLDTTNQPLKRIAHGLGFSDPLYFSRTFRKIQGMSPRKYRQTVKG
ncbi:MAG TPA: AraC family transcriptional regulator [Bryobacteraceae bacterium]|nr:AraC family transcriptional regulator [Bryobacteraceae bacterium]